MAVNGTSYIQVFSGSRPSPSRFAGEQVFWLSGDLRRHLSTTMVQGGRVVGYWIAPWAGVIEEVRTTQQIAGGGGGGQNSIGLSVGPAGSLVDCFAVAADGNTMLDNAAAGNSALTYPTDNLTACNDGVSRVKFNLGDVIALSGVAGAAAYGTADTEIIIAREFPASSV